MTEIELTPFSPEISSLLSDGFLMVSKDLVQMYGPVEAIVLVNLIEKDKYFRLHKNSNSDFFLDKAKQEKELNITSHILRKAIKKLSILNLVHVKRRGIPPRYWYIIDYNEIQKAVNLYRSKISTFKDVILRPIINNNKDNNNKLKPIGEVATQQTPTDNSNEPNLEVLRKKKILQRKADKVISQLNKLTGKKFQKIDSNRKFIIARLNDGFKYPQLIEVIKTKIQDPYFQDNPKYFRPATLFNPTNFDSYLNEDPKDYKKSNNQNTPSNGSGYNPNSKYNVEGEKSKVDFNKAQNQED